VAPLASAGLEVMLTLVLKLAISLKSAQQSIRSISQSTEKKVFSGPALAGTWVKAHDSRSRRYCNEHERY
jgi:hypothetical protein